MKLSRLAATLLVLAAAPSLALADAKAGKSLYVQCAACHGAKGEGTGMGPGLVGIVGRPVAAEDGFAYSSAMKRSKVVWNEANLKAFLVKPAAVVPGTRMVYPGVGSPQKADDLVAYLKSLR
jgi:cytochrome c